MSFVALLLASSCWTGALGAELTWDEAHAQAQETLKVMTRAEKHTLLRGIGWVKTQYWWDLEPGWYVGNTAPIKRLGIPSLNMEDASSGFRTYWNWIVGTVTVWPSLLALSATWDTYLVNLVAQSIGKEFADKGANGLLGPGVNVQRVARNGRNFEYLSGEDPYLGSQLAPAYIKGVQSNGLFCVVKHWVFNEQETRRDNGDSVVDNKTAWEIYYPPFQAAIDAEVGAFMCSYNKVNGEYSCKNKQQLHILKEKMKFRGFVQSDWWATHTSPDSALQDGLDQEMPGSGPAATGNEFSDAKLYPESETLINEAAGRVLAAMHKFNLMNSTKCAPPNCLDHMKATVTSSYHVSLARRAAADSVVLLKNDAGVLPLRQATSAKIAIVGAAAAGLSFNPSGVGQGSADSWHTGDYYAGGGSGHVTTPLVVSPLVGIQRRAKELGISVVSSPSNQIATAIRAADQADVAIVVVGTTSGESVDRANLNLDGNADGLISALASRSTRKKIIVLMQIPGAVVMPWRDSVPSILALFMGGQETGNAWADVLFGDHPPSGRLPISMPESEADTIPPVATDQVVYSEGVATGYRNTKFKVAFPFGHGLTYTTFNYSNLQVGTCERDDLTAACIQMKVTNVGQLPGLTVPQLYLQFPAEAGFATPILKGFQKTSELNPGETQDVTFRLKPRDVSYFDVTTQDFVQANSFTVFIGESFSDIRFQANLNLRKSAVLSNSELEQVASMPDVVYP